MTGKRVNLLPEEFADLEPFVDVWAKPTEAERHLARETSTIEDIDLFYSVMAPRMNDVLSWLSKQPPHGPEGGAPLLLNLAFGLVEASLAAEIYRQPEVINRFDRSRLHFVT